MFTRNDYMNNACTHSEFYGQFVTPAIITRVKSKIGADAIARSTNEHFNDIKLDKWEAIDCKDVTNSQAIRQAFETPAGKFFWSKNLNVCILKEAARRIKLAV